MNSIDVARVDLYRFVVRPDALKNRVAQGFGQQR